MKITDKMRLDWLALNWKEPMLIQWAAWANTVFSPKELRDAIDVVIKAEKKKGK